MKRLRQEIPGLLFAAFCFAFGTWLLGSGDLSFHTCGNGRCASGTAIALSAITVGFMFLAVSVSRIAPEKWKLSVGRTMQKLATWRHLRNAPKYEYGELPARDENAIDEAVRKSRNGK